MDAAHATLAVIRRRYPSALTADTVDRLVDLMRVRLAVLPERIMFGDSICSDEVSGKREDWLPALLG